jgi:hypothetical protein
MASRPTRWRILAVFGGQGQVAGEDEKSLPCGAIQEFTDLAGSEAEVNSPRDAPFQHLGPG